MLYDPKRWQYTTPTDTPWNLKRFIAWLETKPLEKTFCYHNPQQCAIAQYLIHCGVAKYELPSRDIPSPFYEIVQPRGCEMDMTFGEALRRARYVSTKKAMERGI